MKKKKFKVVFVVGEVSGDELAADLFPVLKKSVEQKGFEFQAIGLAGAKLQSLGVNSFFPISDIAIMGFTSVLWRLPYILRHIKNLANYILQEKPDCVILVDSPDFCLALAKHIWRGNKESNSEIPIFQYVCPSVWAWRSWRAGKMRKFISHVFTLLPFEVAALKKLNGPPATYVGHPLIFHDSGFYNFAKTDNFNKQVPTLLVLPGSRKSEIARLLPLFGKTLELLQNSGHKFKAVLPAVPHLQKEISQRVKNWHCEIEIVSSKQNEKIFSQAHVALAASGTVSLQLALHGVPMVIAYKLDIIARCLSIFLRNTWSVVLPNLIIGKAIVPEYIDGEATPKALAASIKDLLYQSSSRQKQLAAFVEIKNKLKTKKPSNEIIVEKIHSLLKIN